MQVVAAVSHSAADADATAHDKASDATAAQAALEEACDEAQRLAVRASTLLAQLAHERQSKRVQN